MKQRNKSKNTGNTPNVGESIETRQGSSRADASAKGKTGVAVKGKYGTATRSDSKGRGLLLLILALCVVPLIVLVHRYQTELNEYAWFSGHPDGEADIFLFFKGVLLIILSAVMLCYMVFLFFKESGEERSEHGAKKSGKGAKRPSGGDTDIATPHLRDLLSAKRNLPVVIASGVFALMALLSSVFSEHASDAFFGGHDEFEGCFILISYAICFLFAFLMIRSERQLRILFDALMVGAAVIGVIGVLQLLGWNILQNGFFQSIINLTARHSNITYSSAENTSYATLYNPNYVGFYVVLVIPYAICLIRYGKSLVRRIFAAVTALLMVIFQYGSHSDTGWISLGAGVAVGVFLLMPSLKRRVRLLVVAGGVVLMGAFVYILVSRGFTDAVFVQDEELIVENMQTVDDSVVIETADGKRIRAALGEETLQTLGWSVMTAVDKLLKLTDADTGAPISYTMLEDGKAEINESGYPAIDFYIDTGVISADVSKDGNEYSFDQFHVFASGRDYLFTTMGDGKLMHYCFTNVPTTLRHVDRAGFKGLYSFGSGRGYLWACTLPMLKDYLIVGAGPDNFVYAYPNDDFVGKRNWGYDYQVATKPHNLFLQIWVQDGLIALLAFLFLYGLLMVRVAKMCWGKHGRRYMGAVAIATAVGASAYMIQGLANDSIVCVAPVYWVLLGVGYAAEGMWRREVVQATDE